MDSDERIRLLAQASLEQANRPAGSNDRRPTPPLFMVPTGARLREVATAQRLAPRLPPAGKVAMWVWFMAGDPAGEPMLQQVLNLAELYKAVLVPTFYCVILPQRLDRSVNFTSVINERIMAIPDIGGQIAKLYANGQVPAVVRVVGDDRRLVSVRQLADFLETFSPGR